MSFKKHNFVAKQTLTAQAMNEIEDGIVTNETTMTLHNLSDTAHTDIREEIKQLSANVIDLKLNSLQQTPLFVNNISECVDTTKLYVLPDGYIYSYMEQLVTPYTNQIPLSVNSDGTIFVGEKGENGYIANTRLTFSTGDCTTNAGSAVTGFIRVKTGDTVRIKGMTIVSGGTSVNTGMVIYKSNFSRIEGITEKYFSTFGYLITDVATDSAGTVMSFKVHDKYNNGITYLRFCTDDLNADSVITINEEITEPIKTYTWANTGHAFVPADYEDRVIAVEKAVTSNETRLKNLEMYGAESVSGEEIPSYIKAEAEAVINRVIEAKEDSSRCFTIVGLSDFHYYNYDSAHNSPDNDNRRTLINAAKAINYIGNRMHIDAVATLGDIVPFGTTDDGAIHYAKKYFKEINEILSMTQQSGIIDFRAVGNHDRAGGNDSDGNPTPPISDNTIYSYIGGYNRQCDYVNVPAGYGYKDFTGYKLRVIVLNTAECEGKGRFSTHSGFHISNEQYKWLIDTLDLSAKNDASEWQILILSHHRADDWQVQTDGSSDSKNSYILPNILSAYKTGGSYSGVIADDGISVSCNFEGKNQAKLIGQIHGHHHNYKFQNLYRGAVTNSTQTNIIAIGTPTTSFVENGNTDNDGNTYTSVKDTASDTAFCIYSIDLDNHKVYAIHYGNGIDREIGY